MARPALRRDSLPFLSTGTRRVVAEGLEASKGSKRLPSQLWARGDGDASILRKTKKMARVIFPFLFLSFSTSPSSLRFRIVLADDDYTLSSPCSTRQKHDRPGVAPNAVRSSASNGTERRRGGVEDGDVDDERGGDAASTTTSPRSRFRFHRALGQPRWPLRHDEHQHHHQQPRLLVDV